MGEEVGSNPFPALQWEVGETAAACSPCCPFLPHLASSAYFGVSMVAMAPCPLLLSPLLKQAWLALSWSQLEEGKPTVTACPPQTPQ